MGEKEKNQIMSMSYEEKKSFLIALLEEAQEVGDWIDWNDMDEETINQIIDVLFIEDEKSRNEKIGLYLENERKKFEEHHNNLMFVVSQIQQFDVKMKELKSKSQDELDIASLEEKF